MTPEKRVKERVKNLIKKYDAYYAMPATGGYGNSGVPDFLVCLRGRFIGIECKAGRGKTTALQDMNLEQIRKAWGISFVVNVTNIDSLEQEFKRICEEEDEQQAASS